MYFNKLLSSIVGTSIMVLTARLEIPSSTHTVGKVPGLLTSTLVLSSNSIHNLKDSNSYNLILIFSNDVKNIRSINMRIIKIKKKTNLHSNLHVYVQ